MALPKDILEALDTLAIWRRLKPLPDEVTELRGRIERLEAMLAGGSGLAQCPLCNSLQFKRVASKPDSLMAAMGIIQDSYRCQSCGHQEDRPRDEAPQSMR